jgi:hypothetical protein
MARDWDDNDESEWDDPESDGEDWDHGECEDDEADEPTKHCYYCRAEIHEDTERCPECGNYQSQEDAPSQPKPLWLVAGVVICLLLVLWWALPFLFVSPPE